MRYRLRTLMILMALLPPALAAGYWRWAKTVRYQSIRGGICGHYVIDHYNDGSRVEMRVDRTVPLNRP